MNDVPLRIKESDVLADTTALLLDPALKLADVAKDAPAEQRCQRQHLPAADQRQVRAWVACGDFDVLYEEIGFKGVETTWTR